MILKSVTISLFIFIIFGVSVPFLSSAQTSTSTPVSTDTQALIKQLQVLILSLQTQINELKAKLEATRTDLAEVKEEVRISRSLSLGISGDDVKQLQEVLKQDPEIYPEGLVTGFFGSKTAAAVKRFQEKHGIEAVGFVGPKTLAKLNELITSSFAKVSTVAKSLADKSEDKQGAGKSGVIPLGLERRFGTTTPEQAPSLSTPSGTIPAQPIGQTGTTTIPAVSAFSATTTIPVLTPIPPIVPPPPVIPLIPVQLPPAVATSTTNTSAYDAWYATTPPTYNIVVRSTSSTGAVINWNTKDVSDSEIHIAASPITSGVSFTRVLAVPNSSKTFHEAIVSSLNSGTTYYYVVIATNTAGKITTSVESSFATLSPVSSAAPVPSSSSTPVPSPSPTATTTTSTADTTAPSSPTNLTATPVYNWHVTLTWSKSTDNVGVVGYNVYRNGTQLFSAATSSSLSTLTYRDWNVTAGTAYSYTVAAYDAAGNVSGQSSAVSVTPVTETTSSSTPTPTPTPSPTPTPAPSPSASEPAVYAPFGSAYSSSLVISNIQEYVGPTGKSWDGTLYATLYVTWTTNAQATTQYSYKSPSPVGDQSGTQYVPVVTNHKTTIGLRSGSTYYYQLKATDANGNIAVSDSRTFVAPVLNTPSVIDTTLPIISNVKVQVTQISTGSSSYQATITWTTDDPSHTGVFYTGTAYDTSGGMWDIHTPLTTSHTIVTDALSANVKYEYTLSSYNANAGETSYAGNFTTPPSSSPSPSPSATTTAQQTSRDSLLASLHTLLASLQSALALLIR